jgi:hypothetical protein
MRSSTNNYAAARTALHSRNEAYYLDLGLVDPLPVWALDVEIRVVTDLITQVEGGHERTLS